MKHTEEMIKKVSQGISNPSYQDNLQATKELMELFDYLKEHPITRLMAEKHSKHGKIMCECMMIIFTHIQHGMNWLRVRKNRQTD